MKYIVVNDFDYVQGGASKVAIENAMLLHRTGESVVFFSGCSKNEKYPFPVFSLNQKEVANGQNPFRNLYNKKAINSLMNLINDSDEYIVIIHGWTKILSSSIFKVGKKKNVSVILTCHDYFSVCANGGLYNYGKDKICFKKCLSASCILCNCDSRNYCVKMYRIFRYFIQYRIVNIHKYIKKYITISDFSQNILCKSIDERKMVRIDNPMNICKNERSQCEKSDYFIFVGRIDKEKGVEDFCKAITKTGAKGIVVGDGKELKRLKENYANISFTGWLDTNDAFALLKKARCLVFPSHWYEGAPLIIYEAMSFGVPCIISDCSAATDIVNNENGFVYTVGNIDELANKIEESLNDISIEKKSKMFYSQCNHIQDKKDYILQLMDMSKEIVNE